VESCGKRRGRRAPPASRAKGARETGHPALGLGFWGHCPRALPRIRAVTIVGVVRNSCHKIGGRQTDCVAGLIYGVCLIEVLDLDAIVQRGSSGTNRRSRATKSAQPVRREFKPAFAPAPTKEEMVSSQPTVETAEHRIPESDNACGTGSSYSDQGKTTGKSVCDEAMNPV
jgi:hypothetical protein